MQNLRHLPVSISPGARRHVQPEKSENFHLVLVNECILLGIRSSSEYPEREGYGPVLGRLRDHWRSGGGRILFYTNWETGKMLKFLGISSRFRIIPEGSQSLFRQWYNLFVFAVFVDTVGGEDGIEEVFVSTTSAGKFSSSWENRTFRMVCAAGAWIAKSLEDPAPLLWMASHSEPEPLNITFRYFLLNINITFAELLKLIYASALYK